MLDCVGVTPGYWAPRGSKLPIPCPQSGFMCPGATYDSISEPPGSLPIEVEQGRMVQWRTVVEHRCHLQLLLPLADGAFPHTPDLFWTFPVATVAAAVAAAASTVVVAARSPAAIAAAVAAAGVARAPPGEQPRWMRSRPFSPELVDYVVRAAFAHALIRRQGLHSGLQWSQILSHL